MEKADLSSEKSIGFAFSKEERLCSKKHIEELYKKGSSTFLYPFRVVYLSRSSSELASPFPKVLISVPKRLFKKAVDRNRIKRQIREIYRNNKRHLFEELEQEQIPVFLSIVYVGKEKLPFLQLERKLISILLRFKKT